MERRRPDFVIPGFARCGTTWLYETLRRHPRIFLPERKELDFFSESWAKGYLFYAAYFLILGIQLPFWPVWLESRGLSAGEIGTVLAVAL